MGGPENRAMILKSETCHFDRLDQPLCGGTSGAHKKIL
jgi:hypothetical protein